MMPIDLQQLRTALHWQIEAGADEAIAEAPINWFEHQAEAARPKTSRAGGKASDPGRQAAPAARTRTAPATPESQASIAAARALAAGAADLAGLQTAMAGFEGCGLKATAKSLVFSDGAPDAEVMLVGEAPGAEEDRQGKPFVGASGALLDRMFATIGRSRADIYIANILPWRPPGNRTPSPLEREICLPFIKRHIELAAPKYVVLLGATAAQSLLETSEGITRMRGRWRDLSLGQWTGQALPTYHPAYLLRNPAAKAQSWQDLLSLSQKLDGA